MQHAVFQRLLNAQHALFVIETFADNGVMQKAIVFTQLH